jgi:hypothetical protein
MMQGGGGNGNVSYRVGASYTGEKPALVLGEAITEPAQGQDRSARFLLCARPPSLSRLACLAGAQVAEVAIARGYLGPAAYSYFVGNRPEALVK